jgi:hypothetical protein
LLQRDRMAALDELSKAEEVWRHQDPPSITGLARVVAFARICGYLPFRSAISAVKAIVYRKSSRRIVVRSDGAQMHDGLKRIQCDA